MAINKQELLNNAVIQISKEYDIPEDTLHRLILELKKRNKVFISLDENWRYPKTGDSQRTCPMLDAMFNIEREKGIIIFLPFKD